MPFKTLNDRLQHLKELADLEKMFFSKFDVEAFYNALTKYATANFDMESGHLPSREELNRVDTWVSHYLQTRLGDSETWIVRAFVVGKLLETAERTAVGFALDVSKLHPEVANAAANYGLNLTEVQALDWAKLHGGENMKNVGNGTAAIVRRNLMEAIQDGGGQRDFQRAMEKEALQTTGDINRMWRRVAITEVNSAFNNGYLMQMEPETWVMGLSMPDACINCRTFINGKVFLTVKQAPPANYMTLDKRLVDYCRDRVYRDCCDQ